MQITIRNLTSKTISTPLGALSKYSSLVDTVSDSGFSSIIAELKQLRDAGLISLDIADSQENQFASINRGPNLVSTQDLTLYVDAVNGSDTGNGTEARPFRLLQQAIDSLPVSITHNVVINVAAGTYDQPVTISNTIIGLVTIRGTSWTTSTVATGINTGTFDAAFVGQPTIMSAVATGAGWTINDLTGKFIRIDSGAHLGRYIPILSNTADTIMTGANTTSTSYGGSALQSVNFTIVEPSAVLTTTTNNIVTGSNNVVYINGIHDGTYGTSTTLGGNGIAFENLTINVASVPILGSIRCESNQVVRFTRCKFGASSWIGTRRSVAMHVGYCSFAGAASVPAILSGTDGDLMAYDSVFYGGGSAIQCTANTSARIGGALQNTASLGVFVSNGTMSVVSALYVDSCRIGITISDAGKFVAPASPVYITNNTLEGILCGQNSYDAGGQASLTNTLIDLCGTGIALASPDSIVSIAGTTSITNSTTFGVDMALNKRSAFSQFESVAALTMSGNTSGDFRLETANIQSLAALRADPNKDILDAIRLNRLFEN